MVCFGTLVLVVLLSSVILIRQYLRGDLGEPRSGAACPSALRSKTRADRHRRRAA